MTLWNAIPRISAIRILTWLALSCAAQGCLVYGGYEGDLTSSFLNPVAATLTVNEVMTIVTASGCPASYIASQTVWVGSTTYVAIPNTVTVANEAEGVPFLVIFNYPGLTLAQALTSSALAEVSDFWNLGGFFWTPAFLNLPAIPQTNPQVPVTTTTQGPVTSISPVTITTTQAGPTITSVVSPVIIPTTVAVTSFTITSQSSTTASSSSTAIASTFLPTSIASLSSSGGPSTSTQTAAPVNSGSSLSSGAIGGIVGGILGGFLVLSAVIYFLFRQRRATPVQGNENVDPGAFQNDTVTEVPSDLGGRTLIYPNDGDEILGGRVQY